MMTRMPPAPPTNPPQPMGSLWSGFGLKDDPFFQQPLDPGRDTEHPASRLFVGREEELRLLLEQVLSSSTSRVVVEGNAGVGKTSFINRAKVEMQQQGVLLHRDPVRVQQGMRPHQFMAEVLKVLLQINASVTLPETASRTDKIKNFF